MLNDDLTLGLTLGGGGAFGAAHVGVLQVLHERGIRPGIVTGTSSGAIVAAAYAAGLGADEIEDAARSFRWREIARWSLRPRWGLLDTHAVTNGVHRVLGEDPLIEHLPRRFGAYATDLRTRRGDPLLIFGAMSVTDTLPYGSAADVRAEVARIMDLARDRVGLVFMTSNTITPDTPLENILAYWHAVQASGW